MDERALQSTTVTSEEEDLLNAPLGPDPLARGIPITRELILAVSMAALYLLYQAVLVHIRIANMPLLTSLSLISLVITLVFTVAVARSLSSPTLLAAVLVSSAAIMLPFVLLPILPLRTADQSTAVQIYKNYAQVFHNLPGISGLLLICLAASVGVAVSRLVREVKLLLPIGVVLALVDLYVVFGGGLVSQAQSGKSRAAQAAMSSLLVSLTPRMPHGVHAPPPLAVGFADYMFIALFFACFARFHVPSRRTFVILTGVLCTYMLAVVISNISLPALVPIAVVIIGCNQRLFRYDAEERKAMMYAGLLLVAILGIMVVISRR